MTSEYLQRCSSKTELMIAGVWVNITRWTYWRDAVNINRGSTTESDLPPPAELNAVLLNDGGRFSPRNLMSPYYPDLGRNTQLRASVNVGDPSALLDDADTVTAPDDPAFAITGDIEVRIDAELPSWRNERGLAARYEITGDERSWALYVADDGTLTWVWSPDGTLASRRTIVSPFPVPVTGGRLAIRVLFDVDNGAGNAQANFYTAATIDDSWTLLGAAASTGTTSVHGGSAPIELGDVSDIILDGGIIGRIYAFELYDGWGGTPVADPDFRTATDGDTSLIDGQGNTWTVQADAELTNRRTRLVGEVASWPQEWDDEERAVRTAITANGITRRLSQGDSAIESTMRRGILGDLNVAPIVYWPGEDAAGSTQIASALDHDAMEITDGTVEFGAYTGFDSSQPLPSYTDAIARARIPYYDSSTGELQVRLLVNIPNGATDNRTLLRIYTTGSIKQWSVSYRTANNGSWELRAFDEDDVVVLNTGAISFGIDDVPHMLTIELTQDGADIDWAIAVLEPGAAVGSTFSGTLASEDFSRMWKLVAPGATSSGLTNITIGHLAAWNVVTTIYDVSNQLAAYAGEKAADRFVRLCDENDIASRVIGAFSSTMRMGPQRPLALLTLLQEVQQADLGLLYETREELGLTYRTRESLYNQTPLLDVDCCDGALGGPLKPIDDDRNTRNDITVSRPSGSSARAVQTTGDLNVQPPPDGVGRYDEQVQSNVFTDERLPFVASWLRHLGTIDEPRYHELLIRVINPVIADDLDLLTRVMALEIGDRYVVRSPPSWLPSDDIDQLVIGYREQFTDFIDERYPLTVSARPASGYEVGTYATDEGGTDTDAYRFGTETSTLTSAISDSDMSFQVTTDPEPLWTTDAGEFPIPIDVGGEVMTCSAIAGAASPQTFTITARAVNGTAIAHAAGTAVTVHPPTVRGL